MSFLAISRRGEECGLWLEQQRLACVSFRSVCWVNDMHDYFLWWAQQHKRVCDREQIVHAIQTGAGSLSASPFSIFLYCSYIYLRFTPPTPLFFCCFSFFAASANSCLSDAGEIKPSRCDLKKRVFPPLGGRMLYLRGSGPWCLHFPMHFFFCGCCSAVCFKKSYRSLSGDLLKCKGVSTGWSQATWQSPLKTTSEVSCVCVSNFFSGISRHKHLHGDTGNLYCFKNCEYFVFLLKPPVV